MKSFGILFLFVSSILTLEAKIILQRLGPPPDDEPSARSVKMPLWHTITQRVDHFNPRDYRTWSMRYISNDQFFQEGGPIFFYLGGEWEIGIDNLRSGQIFDMAAQHAGFMFYTEHRYYGRSYPTPDMSTENLRFLSVDQAIADVAYFIQYIKGNVPGLRNSKVVVIGASYSASMATWIRMKYPHLVNVAYASSGPVRAVADFYEYYEVVGRSIGLVSQECLRTISEGVSQLEAALKTERGIDEMSYRLNTCTRIQNYEPHRSHLFYMVINGRFAELVQRGGLTAIQNNCDRLLRYPGNSSLDKLISFVRTYYSSDCIDDYDAHIKTFSAVANTNIMVRPWLYQTCTEYGYYQTTTSNYQPFGNTVALDFFVNTCTDVFGKDFGKAMLDTGIIRTNIFYGSLQPEITKVVSVHGTVDPWHPLGILQHLNPLAPAILINGTTHMADLHSINASDPWQLRDAKKRVQQLIADWLR